MSLPYEPANRPCIPVGCLALSPGDAHTLLSQKIDVAWCMHLMGSGVCAIVCHGGMDTFTRSKK